MLIYGRRCLVCVSTGVEQRDYHSSQQRRAVPCGPVVFLRAALLQGTRPQRAIGTVGHHHCQRGRALGYYRSRHLASTGQTAHETGRLRGMTEILLDLISLGSDNYYLR